MHTFPNEGTANGTVMIQPGDIVILPYCRYVQDQIRLEIPDGFVRKIEGGLDAKLMDKWLEDNKARPDDMDGHAISHLGWGVNSNARWDNIALCGDDDPSYHSGAARVLFQPKFEELDLLQLPNYSIYLKLMIDGTPSAPFSAATLGPAGVCHASMSRNPESAKVLKMVRRPAAN